MGERGTPGDLLNRVRSSSSTTCSQHWLRISSGTMPENRFTASLSTFRTAAFIGMTPPTPQVTLHDSSRASGTRAIAITSAVLFRGFWRVAEGRCEEPSEASLWRLWCELAPLWPPSQLAKLSLAMGSYRLDVRPLMVPSAGHSTRYKQQCGAQTRNTVPNH